VRLCVGHGVPFAASDQALQNAHHESPYIKEHQLADADGQQAIPIARVDRLVRKKASHGDDDHAEMHNVTGFRKDGITLKNINTRRNLFT
jgi:hypothetical protein